MTKVLACTYQAISGAGKTFATWPEMDDNVIPFISGEEEKSEQEPLKIWGSVGPEGVIPAKMPLITTQCLSECIRWAYGGSFCKLCKKPTLEQIKEKWAAFAGAPQKLGLPSAPKQFCIILKRATGPSPSWTGCWKTAWPSA